jgi:hypothetical protein
MERLVAEPKFNIQEAIDYFNASDEREPKVQAKIIWSEFETLPEFGETGEELKKIPALASSVETLDKWARFYLLSPIITDTFGNDHSIDLALGEKIKKEGIEKYKYSCRQAWEHYMAKTYGKELMEVFHRNRLGGVSITPVEFLSVLVMQLDGLGMHTKAAERIREIKTWMPNLSSYGKLSDDEKMKIADSLQKIALALVELFSQKIQR